MIKEAYVSYEVAKLLKEKGFDEPCQHFYKLDSDEMYRGTVFTNSQIGDKFYNAPTHQMAMAWLRGKGWCVCPEWAVFYDQRARCSYNMWQVRVIRLATKEEYPSRHMIPDFPVNFGNYDECTEQAIKYCLTELI